MDIEKLKDLHDKLATYFNIAILAGVEYPDMNLHRNELKLLVKALRYIIDGGKEK